MTHHTDAELLRDIEEHMRKMWDARLLPAVCWPADLAQRLTQAVRRAPAAPVPQGWKLVPDDANMTDEQAEAICAVAKVCGGGAYDIYRAALAAAPQPPDTATSEHSKPMCGAAPKVGPIAWYVTGCSTMLDEHDAKAEAKRCGGTAQAVPLAAAPQPPEAAPVELPEPAAWRDPKNFLPSQGCTYEKSTAKKWAHIYTEALYTEQQVRDLLAAHGIQERST